MKALTVRAIILFSFCYLPFQSMAWGLLGHRVVGEIAEKYLTSSTKKKIQQILGNETLAMSSNWADFIKSDSTYNYLDPWHYVNFEKGLSLSQMQDFLAKDTATDAYTKVNFLITELKKKNLPKDKQLFYLRLLIHIVGDLHQPLHVSAIGTRGGNQVRVLWFNENTNLHRVWDTHLIESQSLSYTELTNAINFSTKEQRKVLQSQSMGEWLHESYSLSNQIHDYVKEPNQKLGYDYIFKYQETLNNQLLKGGIRLAGILNDIFKNQK